MSGPRTYPLGKTLLWLLAMLVGFALGVIPGFLIAFLWEQYEKEFDEAAKAEFDEQAKVGALTRRAEHHRKKFRSPC